MHGKKGKGLSGNWDLGNCASLLEVGNGDWEFANERESGESDNWEKEGRRQRVIQKGEGEWTRKATPCRKKKKIKDLHLTRRYVGIGILGIALCSWNWEMGIHGKETKSDPKRGGGVLKGEQTPHTEKNNREKEKL